MAHLHPALALAFIIPFLPATKKSEGALFDISEGERSALTDFEHAWKLPVDFGLLFFGLTSAGVVFTQIGVPTWLVVLSLVIGKTSGVFTLSIVASQLGFPRPNKMGKRELFLAGVVASLGLTVALFVAGAAFVDIEIQNAAKMGALFSSFVAIIAIILGRVLNIKRETGVRASAHSKPKAVPTVPASAHYPKKG
jgi:NhaA family Na+:H+ antiporter